MTLLLLSIVANGAPQWDPINPAELAEQKPVVDPGAGSEILFREETKDCSSIDKAEDTTYIRVKIYSQQGVHDFSKIELSCDENASIHYITARTIKPDGSVVELNPGDIYERETFKTGASRQKSKTFAPPGLEPGAIIEYRYTTITAGLGTYIPIYFQSAHPSRLVRYKVKLVALPAEYLIGWIARTMSFNCPKQQLKSDKNGYYVFEMANLPAAKSELFQPPYVNTTSAALLFYARKSEDRLPEKYWGWFGKELHERLLSSSKATSTITAALAGIIDASDDNTSKLRKIHDFCRTKIINRNSDTSGISERQLDKLKKNKTASDTLKTGSGTREDINILFAALARAAGFDVRLVACNNRTTVLFNSALTEAPFVMPDRAAAVRVGTQWLYADPGSIYLPFGLLPWENTETSILISDPNGKAEPFPVESAPAESNCITRKAVLQLNADGSIEGDVTETFTGHPETQLKQVLDAKTTAARETYIRDAFLEKQNSAELSNLVIENASSPTNPLKITYHLRVTGYADCTGSRLIFQPAVLQKGVHPFFEASTRRTAIVLNYRSTTNDEVRIVPPKGYVLEQASAPESFDLGSLGAYKTSVSVSKKTGAIIYRRTFTLSGITFAIAGYPAIKEVFDEIHKNDNHTLILNHTAQETPPSPPATTVSSPVSTSSIEPQPIKK